MINKDEININNFVSFEAALQWLKDELGDLYKSSLFDLCITKWLITYFEYDDKRFVYKDDIQICKNLMLLNAEISVNDYAFVGYDGELFINIIKLGKGTFLRYPVIETEKEVPAFIKNIIYLFWNRYKKGEECQYDLFGVSIVTNNQLVSSYISNVIYRKYRLDTIKRSNFSNSSAYMGSKKGLVGFIIEAIWPHKDDNLPILDIMCGSGAASNAFAQMGKVYASDAQRFCQLLAKVQGSGFNIRSAEKLRNTLYNYYKKNLYILQKECSHALKQEKKIFHMDMKNRMNVVNEYQEFVQSFELFSSTENNSEFIKGRINERKKNPNMEPYCLFTYYFSNVYFGLEQCNQIDSIRYAIDQVENSYYKEWLLGVLVISVSVVASNYAGHFAQPRKIDELSIYDMIEKRKRSVWLEFSKRILAIAAESERYPNEIITLEGPWENALKQVKKLENNIIVYLDAPYKREEYSRYYHVLETLVCYDYPSAERKGRLRSLQNGERFKSEFSSRNAAKVEEYFVYMITSIMKQAKVCAWSYSNNCSANIMHIIDRVQKILQCNIYIYSTMHRHASQGKDMKKKRIDVIEYCVVFVRKN